MTDQRLEKIVKKWFAIKKALKARQEKRRKQFIVNLLAQPVVIKNEKMRFSGEDNSYEEDREKYGQIKSPSANQGF